MGGGGGEFDVAYTAAEAGKKVVTGEIKFAVCSANYLRSEEVEASASRST